MREILFRGKRLDNGEWVSGWLKPFLNAGYIGKSARMCIQDGMYSTNIHEVDPDTVGQYIGLTDSNDTKIFEGDIVRCWGGESFGGYYEYTKTILIEAINAYDILVLLDNSENILVIGNIYDNPDLAY